MVLDHPRLLLGGDGKMSEVIEHLDISVRLYILLELVPDMDAATKSLCQDALDEIERLRAEVKKLRRAK